jgi:hypothetical protein
VSVLAANMGTPVEVLETFFGKKRVHDPKMSTEIITAASEWSHLQSE